MNGATLRALLQIDQATLKRCVQSGAGHPAQSYGAKLRLQTTIAGLEQGERAVEVDLTDGSRAAYDLVVGANGLHSRVRELVFPDAPAPFFTGQTVWRAVVPRPPEPDHDIAMYYGSHTKAGRRPLHAVLVPSPWYRGRVLLIGDAAHATTPNLAMGAGIAIEDAVVLGEEVAAREDPTSALDSFMTRRCERCRMVVENSLQLGEWEKTRDVPAADPAGLTDATHAAMASSF